MPKRKPSQAITEMEQRMIDRMNYWMNKITKDSAENYAPKGAGGLQGGLASGITFYNAEKKGGKIIGRIISEAVGADGKSYAKKQHDEVLRHFKTPPMNAGFHEAAGARGDTRIKKYWSGYWQNRDSAPKFATKYLEKPFEKHKREFLADMQRALGGR